MSKRKEVSRGKASVPARKLELVPKGKPDQTIGEAIAASFGGKVPESVKPWTNDDMESCYQGFVSGLKSTYGYTTNMARAIVAGAVTDVQVRDLWATHKEEDTAGKFLAALKEGLRTAQADAKGDLPADAFTYNVNKSTGILARTTIVPRKNKGSLRKLAEKTARFIIKATEGMTEEKAEQYRKNAASMFSGACLDPVTFTAK